MDYDQIGYDASRRYADMMFETSCPWCWTCGRSGADRPIWWAAPFRIERAHIVNKPRREDRRCVVLSCSLCHRVAHGDTFKQLDRQYEISQANMIWIKQKVDPNWYDPEFLQACSVRLLPDAEPLDSYLLDSIKARRRVDFSDCKSVEVVEIVVPMPSRLLSPNVKSHWGSVAKARESAKSMVHFAVLSELKSTRLLWRRAEVSCIAYFKTNRVRDEDNFIAMMKSSFDGLETSGLICDDAGLTHKAPEFKKSDTAREFVVIKVKRLA